MLTASSEAAPSQSDHRPRRRRESRWALTTRMQQLNPCRRSYWRWEWALMFAYSRQPLPKRGLDRLLVIAVQMHYTLRDGQPPASWSRLGSVYEDMQAAFDIYDKDGPRCAEIEARILAGQTDDEIAELVGVMPMVVELFAGIFYDVRDRLQAPDWISASAVSRAGNACWGVTLADDIWRLWRAAGYYGGPGLLNTVIAAVQTPEDLTVGLGECDLQTAEGRLAARARLAAAGELLPWSTKLADELVRMGRLVTQFERADQRNAARFRAEMAAAEMLAERFGQPATTAEPATEPKRNDEAEETCGAGEDASVEASREAA